MTNSNCEDVRLAALALSDGERPILPAAEVGAHLAACAACREEVGQLKAVGEMVGSHKRAEAREDLWPRIESRLGEGVKATGRPYDWQVLLFLGFIIPLYKLIELVPSRELGAVFKAAPVVVALAAFVYLRENPFRVNPDLRLEGEVR